MNKKFGAAITPKKLFFFVSIAGILGFAVLAFVRGSVTTFDWLMMEHNGDWEFADYFAHIFFGQDLTKTYNSFDTDPCFPPLAYLFYHYLYRINPPAEMANWRDAMNQPYNLIIFLMYSVVLVVLFHYAIQLYNRKNAKAASLNEDTLLTVTVLCSVPFFASALERGNAVFLVCVLLLLALAFKDSDSKVLRELALIFIAVSASFKIYPAMFGLLYIKERRWKEAFRLLIYGFLIFIIPFVFFDGIEGIKDFIVMIYLVNGRSNERWTTIRGFITSMYMTFGGEGLKWTGHHVGIIVENIFLVLAFFGAFVSKNKWKSLMLFISPMVVYVSSAYRYTIIYFFLALICMLKEEGDGRTILNYVYAFLFAMIFTIPVWAFGFELEHFLYGAIYVLLTVLLVDVLAGFIREMRAKKLGKAA